jgi:hypothetical protein
MPLLALTVVAVSESQEVDSPALDPNRIVSVAEKVPRFDPHSSMGAEVVAACTLLLGALLISGESKLKRSTTDEVAWLKWMVRTAVIVAPIPVGRMACTEVSDSQADRSAADRPIRPPADGSNEQNSTPKSVIKVPPCVAAFDTTCEESTWSVSSVQFREEEEFDVQFEGMEQFEDCILQFRFSFTADWEIVRDIVSNVGPSNENERFLLPILWWATLIAMSCSLAGSPADSDGR